MPGNLKFPWISARRADAFTLWYLAIFALAQLVFGAGICQLGSTFEWNCLSRLPCSEPLSGVATTDPVSVVS